MVINMKHIVIGTAGHIDHGKTTLIKALTGKDTDTLKEEKERGISINLGFTFFDLPSGKRAGIIDVPGHEKFIKNALAGVSGIDVVLLVIAADEGIMPQTKEHFEILQLLGIKKGIIVITKVDLVDKEWLKMLKEDINDYFKDTFLQYAPIHFVSSKTGTGIKELVNDIDKITEEVETKDIEGFFRMPIDRAFTVSGFGTVVTGTIISGKIKEGDIVEIYPSHILSKIRGIQVHENQVEFAEAGQRCAINLSNIKLNEIKRGDVIATKNTMAPSLITDCSFYYLKSCEKPLKNRQRVKLYHGTNEILCRIIILDKEEILPGEKSYVQLRLEEPLTAQKNDKFVIRNYSPMYTLGGGTIIEPLAKKAKRFDKNYIEELNIKESGNFESILEKTLEKISYEYPNINTISKSIGKNEINIQNKLEELVQCKKIIKLISLDKPIYIHKNFIKHKSEEIEKYLIHFHKNNPLKIGASKEEIKIKIFGKNIKQKIYDEILEILKNKKIININGNYIFLYNFKVKYNKENQLIKDKIINLYMNSKYMPPKYDEIVQNKKDFKIVYDSLIDSGELIKVSEDYILLKKHYEYAKEIVIKFINENGNISVAKMRDMLNTSRKYAVILLEHFDNIKLTKRLGDIRVLYKK